MYFGMKTTSGIGAEGFCVRRWQAA